MPDDDKTADVVQATARLAIAALDHPNLSDEELETLCDIALSGSWHDVNGQAAGCGNKQDPPKKY